MKVLFVCTHNSARSQMAEGLLRHDFGDQYEAFSAGTVETRVHPLAIAAMAELGIDISGHQSEHIDRYDGQAMDYVVTVCDNAREACPYFPAQKQNLHHSFPDPSAATGTDAEKLATFQAVRDEIRTWLAAQFGPKSASQASDETVG